MPRPLSSTLIELSVWIVTMISSQNSASASSTALSTTSNTMWCRPVPSEVSPMYIPGRLRTASSPFSTLMLEESYSPLSAGTLGSLISRTASDPHRHHDVLEVAPPRQREQRARVGVAERAVDLLAVEVVENVEQVAHVEPDIQGFAAVGHVELLLRLLLLGVGAADLQAPGGQHPTHAAELVAGEDRRPLQRLLERNAADAQLLRMLARDDALVVRKLAVDELRHEDHVAEAELRL